MPWILWLLLNFQEVGALTRPVSLKGLDAVRNEAIEREGLRRSLLDDKAAKAAARRAVQAATEAEFVDRFNRVMQAMVDFARSYDEQHTVDIKRLQVVKQALRDLERNDELFKDIKKK
jgi:hypothetical protein